MIVSNYRFMLMDISQGRVNSHNIRPQVKAEAQKEGVQPEVMEKDFAEAKRVAAKGLFQQLAIVLSMHNDMGSNLKNVPLLVIPRRRNFDYSFVTPVEYIASIG